MTIQKRFEAKFKKADGCWNWTASKTPLGYGHFNFDGQVQQAHRVAYEIYIGEIPDGLCVCHVCDNRGCVNPAHLFLGTQADNVHDCIHKGRFKNNLLDRRGERHSQVKLTEESVAEIRMRHAAGEYQKDIAKAFGVSQTNISMIVTRRTWTVEK